MLLLELYNARYEQQLHKGAVDQSHELDEYIQRRRDANYAEFPAGAKVTHAMMGDHVGRVVDAKNIPIEDRRDSGVPVQFGNKIYWMSPSGLKNMQLDVAEGSLNEFAVSSDGGNDGDDSLFNYAKMWYNGDLKTQRQVEKALQKSGLDIGENEDENGGAYISDISGDYYESWTAKDLKQGVAEDINSIMDIVFPIVYAIALVVIVLDIFVFRAV